MLCDAFNFDKTLSLGGYPMTSLASIGIPFIDYDSSKKIFKIDGIEGETLRLLLTKLNASFNLTIRSDITYWGTVYENGSVDGLLNEFLQGPYDLFQHVIPEGINYRSQYYINYQIDLCIASPKRLMNLQRRICKAIANEYLVTSVIIYLIVTGVFAYIQRTGYLKAALELLRALLGVATLRQPLALIGKIIFISCILFFLTLTSYLQSLLYSALTVPRYERYPETENNLIDWNYGVYSCEPVSKQFFTSHLRNRLIILEDIDACTAKVGLNNDNVSVCISYCLALKYLINESNGIDIIEAKDIFKPYLTFVTRENFSLFKRFTTLLRYVQESGIQKYIIRNSHFFRSHTDSSTKRHQAITTSNLEVSFMLLTYSLAFSSFVFFLELMYSFFKRLVA